MSEGRQRRSGLFRYFLIGIFLGIVFTKSEVISWFRIQEMFRFQSFHMYGIIGSAVAVAAVVVALMKRADMRASSGDSIHIEGKPTEGLNYRYWVGGGVFGLGWGLLGACPGPIYALIGNGVGVAVLALVAALAGAWMYGLLAPRLPHF